MDETTNESMGRPSIRSGEWQSMRNGALQGTQGPSEDFYRFADFDCRVMKSANFGGTNQAVIHCIPSLLWMATSGREGLRVGNP